jgi:hypothetical protein
MDNPLVPQEEEKPKALSEMTPKEVIFTCGKLNLPVAQVVRILQDKLLPAQRGSLLMALESKGSPEYQLYEEGRALGDAELQLTLHDRAALGDSDAYKNLTAEQRKNAINESIRKNFGIGDSD